ncbi:MAG: hypothetical protein MHPSP_004135, partial [Paramarteilia canceri]
KQISSQLQLNDEHQEKVNRISNQLEKLIKLDGLNFVSPINPKLESKIKLYESHIKDLKDKNKTLNDIVINEKLLSTTELTNHVEQSKTDTSVENELEINPDTLDKTITKLNYDIFKKDEIIIALKNKLINFLLDDSNVGNNNEF